MIALDRNMPKSCGDCPCNDDSWRCGATKHHFDYYNEGFDCEEGRLPDCPLIDLSKYEDDGK